MNERKRSDPHTHEHSTMEERYAVPRKRHPSAPQSAITNGPLPNNAQPETDHQEWVTPLSLSFHQTKQQLLLKKMIMELNMYQLQFKLGPAYGLYMVAKHLYASESQSGSSASERKKTVITGLKSISSHLKRTVKENRSDVGALAFWLANTTELLHFLRQDYQLGLLSNDYDISLIHLTHLIYKYFVACMNKELQVFLPAFYDDSTVADQDDPPAGYTSGPESVLSRIGKEPDVVTSSRSKVSRHSSMSSTHYVGGAKVSRRGRSTIHDVLQTLNSTITILKRCHVNATLSIMVFSNLFRYISVKVFNKLVSGEVKHCGRSLGQRLCKRLGKVKGWAEREGMELPAETHLTMVVEVANLLQASKKHTDNAQTIFASCPHLNSLQMSTLLELCVATDGEAVVNKTLVDDLVHLARGRDDILRGEGLDVQLEEDLHAEHLFQIPGEGYSGETVSGVPGGLQEFLQPMISAGLCKLTVAKDSSGMWSPPVRNVSSSQSMDHSISPQIPESPQTYNTLPKTTTKSHKSSADNEFRHNSLPRHSNPDLKILKVTISKENNTLGISIVAAKLTTNARFNGETGIFVKSTMDGGPADGHLRPGDQILEVDGNDLVGCTQERASQVLRSTGKKVTLLVAKQAAQYYGIQQSSPRYNRNAAPEGSSHAKKAARRLKRAQKERQQQERYTAELRLERKQLEHNTELAPSSDLRFPPNTNPQIAKWILEQNALHNSEKGSEVEGPGSTSSLSNIGDQDGRTSSPVSSFATSSSRRTKSSYERYSHRTGSPPIRDSPRPSSRPHEVHSTSPFDAPELLEAQTMSDSASKFSDYSAEPEYSSPAPKSAPPVSSLPRMSYRDAFNSSSLYSQQMSNSLTPYSQQQVPSQPGHLDKLSMDVMYHTPQSGASLSGISSIVPRMQGKGGKPYLGRVHLKELDGDEIDLEKQRIKLMFYEKKNEERALQEEDEASLQQEGATTDPLQKGYTSSPPPPPMNTGHQFQGLSSLEEDQGKAFWDDEGQSPEVRELLHELTTLEHMVTEQRRHYKELKYARERENLNLQKAEVDFHEQELLEPAAGGVMSMSATHQDKWQKEQKKRLRQLERFRTEQKDKMQKIEVEEHHTRAKLKAFEANINELRQQIDILVTNGHPKSSAVVESHVQPYRSEYLAEGTDSRGSPIFTGELQSRDDHLYRPGDTDTGMPPERDWPKEAANSKPNPGRFISVESLNSAANEPPDFSRELVNTISESTNMTEPTQDDLVPSRWSSKFVPSNDDPYAAEFSSKYSYSDDEFFMDNTRMKFESGSPIDAHPFNSTSERDVRRPMYHQPPHLPNSHATGHHNLHVIGGGAINQPPDEEIDDSGPLQWAGGHHKKRGPPPVSEKPQNYTGGRTGHHYSRSNRPRMHNRNHQLHSSENLSTVSGVSAASSHTTNQEFLKDDVQKTSSAQFTRESTKPSLNRSADTAPQSPSYLASVTPSSPPQPPYSPSSPSNTSAAVYDIPRKASNKPAPSTAIPTAIYDMPRPSSSSPQHKVNHGNPPLPPNSSSPQPISSLYGSKPQDISRSPFHSKSHDRPTPNYSPHEQQHYDVPKPLSEQNRPSTAALPAEHATTRPPTAANTTTHLYNYHGLPTKPSAPRSYSRGRQDAVGYPADRGFRGQVSRPTHSQRVQRQQTEL